jgi:hypothetical protein
VVPAGVTWERISASVMSALPSIAAAVGIAMMLALVGSIGVE